MGGTSLIYCTPEKTSEVRESERHISVGGNVVTVGGRWVEILCDKGKVSADIFGRLIQRVLVPVGERLCLGQQSMRELVQCKVSR